MSMIKTLVLFAVVVFTACQQSGEPAASPSTPVATSEERRPEPQPAATTPADAPAPTVTRNADGTVTLRGLDRWGTPMLATYESVDWLEKALPVLSRALTDANAAELAARVQALH